jgi:hypothetical protein
LNQLLSLDLSRCLLETVEPGAFAGLVKLRELRLHANRLNYLGGDSLFPPALNHVEVREKMGENRIKDNLNWPLAI